MSYEQKKDKVVPIHTIKEYGNKGINPLICNLSARWRLMVNIMPQLKPQYPLSKGIGGP
jgi:hypothetical protein